MPAASPTQIDANIKMPSSASRSETRNRTAATIAANPNASARLFCISNTIVVAQIGKTSSVLTKLFLYPASLDIALYVQATGNITSNVPMRLAARKTTRLII